MGLFSKFIFPDVGKFYKPRQKEEYHFLLPNQGKEKKMVVSLNQKNSNTHIGLFALWICLDAKNWSERVKHHKMLLNK